MTRLLNTLLDVSRIASGRLPLALEDVDLAEVATDVISQLAESEQAQITCVLESTIGRWDRARLKQVVTNLVTNALKYGEGKAIDVVVTAHGEGARLEVSDHGIGVAAEHHERIFERFERAVTDRRYAGLASASGLQTGLSTSLTASSRSEAPPAKEPPSSSTCHELRKRDIRRAHR